MSKQEEMVRGRGQEGGDASPSENRATRAMVGVPEVVNKPPQLLVRSSYLDQFKVRNVLTSPTEDDGASRGMEEFCRASRFGSHSLDRFYFVFPTTLNWGSSRARSSRPR